MWSKWAAREPSEREDLNLESRTGEFEEPFHEHSGLFGMVMEHDGRADAEDEVLEGRRSVWEEFAVSRVQGVGGAVGGQLVLSALSLDGGSETGDPGVHHEVGARDFSGASAVVGAGRSPGEGAVGGEEERGSEHVEHEVVEIALFRKDQHDEVHGQVQFHGFPKVAREVDHLVFAAGHARMRVLAGVSGLLPQRRELFLRSQALRVQKAQVPGV